MSLGARLGLFKSRFALRVFLLFILCSLVPLVLIGFLSLNQVTTHLQEQSYLRLDRASKALGMHLYGRLLELEATLQGLRGSNEFPATPVGQSRSTYMGPLGRQFKSIHRYVPTETRFVHLLEPDGQILYKPTSEDLDILKQGQTAIRAVFTHNQHPSLYMLTPTGDAPGGEDLFIGLISPGFLWEGGFDASLPPQTEYQVVDDQERIIVSSFPERIGTIADLAQERRFVSRWNGEEYMAAQWPLFLQARFHPGQWTVVLSQSRTDVLEPILLFSRVFPLIILLSFLVITLVSIMQIRKRLLPLDELKQLTAKIADRDFTSRVVVKSGDEFEELADSFNLMSSKLSRNFETLTTISEIDRAILSTIVSEELIEIFLSRLQGLYGAAATGLFLYNNLKPAHSSLYLRREGRLEQALLDVDEKSLLRCTEGPESHRNQSGHALAPVFDHFSSAGCTWFMTRSLTLRRVSAGVVIMGYVGENTLAPEDLDQFDQLCDQLSVALNNAMLMDELKEMHWGTMTALARAVDAKSSWTAGHSERVTAISLNIAREMGVDPIYQDTIHRAGLLHDIGKIGISSAILDKNCRLTEAEFAKIKKHPEMGAVILQPISAYEGVISIVTQHHERFDGSGYPLGLARDEISLGARILAVADVFDAMVSDRPYRRGMSFNEVVAYLADNAGRLFDPQVVRVFLTMADGYRPGCPPGETANPSPTGSPSGPDDLPFFRTMRGA
jgi:putative nucleotidyltransferase with HDIG domain